jgi:hypothetical protein
LSRRLSRDGLTPRLAIADRGDNELFDYFLDFNLVAEALAGVEAASAATSCGES